MYVAKRIAIVIVRHKCTTQLLPLTTSPFRVRCRKSPGNIPEECGMSTRMGSKPPQSYLLPQSLTLPTVLFYSDWTMGRE